jgi:hypothetical protein
MEGARFEMNTKEQEGCGIKPRLLLLEMRSRMSPSGRYVDYYPIVW